MSDKIVHMPPPAHLTSEDLKIAEDACHANAARCRRKGAIEEADHWQRVAENVARARTARWPSKD
jgi:hypothetical protein